MRQHLIEPLEARYAPAALTILGPGPVIEGNSGTTTAVFTVMLDEASTEVVHVEYETLDGTALAGADYIAITGTVTFQPGETLRTIEVQVLGDTLDEDDETFRVRLFDPQGATLDVEEATATILDDDPAPTISIRGENGTNTAAIFEGDSGEQDLTFVVQLSQASGREVRVRVMSMDGTATSGEDFEAFDQEIVFAPGETSISVNVKIFGDVVDEPDETFTLSLSGAVNATINEPAATAIGVILNDEVSVSIGDVSIVEGNSGQQTLVFTISLDQAPGFAVSVNYSTRDGTATSTGDNRDYEAAGGTLTFLPGGPTSQTVEITIFGDTNGELDEDFFLDLTSVTNARLLQPSARGVIENDDPVLRISDAQITEGTPGEPDNPSGNRIMMFTVTLDFDRDETVSVSYQTINGTALAGLDFTGASGQLIFNPGETTKTISVTILGDALDENDETFTVRLSNATGAFIAVADGTGTIVDNDDPPTISIVGLGGAPSTTLFEGDSGFQEMIFTVALSSASGKAVTVRVATADGTAIAGTADAGADYEAFDQIITLQPGTTSQQIRVRIFGDELNELDENFTISISEATNAGIDESKSSASGVIRNDDAKITIDDVSVVEGNSGQTQVTFTISIDQLPPGTVTVDFSTRDGTATSVGGNADYIAQTGTLTFLPDGPLTQQVTVSINGDLVGEFDEDFFLDLTNATNAQIIRAQGRAVILNDDATLRISDATAFESSPGGSTIMAFTVTLENGPEGEVSVAYRTQNGTAEAGSDFVGVSGEPLPRITFAPGETTQQIFITILGNVDADQLIETFSVILSDPTGIAAGGILDNTGIGTIIDSETPLMSISNPTLTEGNGGISQMVFVVSLNRASSSPVTVSFATVDGTAVSSGANPDFDPRSGTLTFNPGTTQQVISVPIRGDTIFEGTETFTVELSGLSNNAFFLSATGTGTILDNDPMPVVSITGGSVIEGNSGTVEAEFIISLNVASGAPVTVTFNTQDGTALAGSDYIPLLGSVVTFAPGETTKTVKVNVNGDTDLEPDEIFRGVLSNASGATLGTSSADMNIRNDEIAVTIADASFAEGNAGSTVRSVLVSLSTSPLAGVPVVVTFDFINGTAVLGSDFNPLNPSRTLIFNPGETQKSIEFTILGDTLHEAAETFTIVLTNITNAVGTDTSATVTITNDDNAPTISIGDATVVEGNVASAQANPRTIGFTVSLSAPSSLPISVKAFTIAGTATAGADFVAILESQAVTITFAPGETEKLFFVTINGDTVDEVTETFTAQLIDARIGNVSAPAGTVIKASAIGTILDDDLRTVSIGDARAIEGASGITIMTFTVSLSQAANLPVSVDFATFNGTAVAGLDYNSKTGTVTFAPGELSKTIEIEILGDMVNEFDELFFVRLANPVNILIGDGEGRGTIVTDEVNYSLEVVGGTTITEGAAGTEQFMRFKVTRAGFSLATPGSVAFTTVDGTAVSTGARRDFDATSGVLTFAAGETEKTVTVRIIGDANFEVDETFRFRLSDPVNGTIVNADQVPVLTLDRTITIANDDARPTITINDVRVTEGNSASGITNATFTITLSAANERETILVNVESLVAEGTARAAAADGFLQDYRPLAKRTLTFAPGVITQTVTIDVLHDLRDEQDEETFTLGLSDARVQVGQGEDPISIGFTGGKEKGVGTIVDDDAAPVLRFGQAPGGPANGDLRIIEGNPGVDTTAMLRLTLSEASERGVTVNITTIEETARLGQDFLEGPDFTSLITFGPGETSKSIEYIIKGDLVHESDETFGVVLSNPVNAVIADSGARVTILNDDPLPALTINDLQLAEGNSGITDFVFTVSLSGPSDQVITVRFTTVDGTATSGGPMPDFLAASGMLTFQPGETLKTVTVSVLGDTVREKFVASGGPLEDERFTVRLSSPTNATLARMDGVGTILDDGDTTIAIQVFDTSVVEGNSGTRPATFVIELSAPASEPTSFRAQTQSGTAAAGSDFVALDSMFTIPAGRTRITVPVQVLGDALFEATESFFLAMSETPESVLVLRSEARGVIFNDDIQQVDLRTIRFVDADGDLVTVRISKGILTFTGANPVLSFRDSGSVGGRILTLVDFTQNPGLYNGTSLSITTEPQPGFSESGRVSDGKVNVGYIRGALIDEFTLRFSQGIDFANIRVDGDVGKIVAGDLVITPAIRGSIQVESLGALGTANMPQAGGSVSSGEISILSSFLSVVNRLHVKGDMEGFIRLLGGPLGSINRLEVEGAIRGDNSANSGLIFFTGRIGSAVIGEIVGGSAQNSGAIIADFSRNSSIGSVTVLGSIVGGSGPDSGRISAPAIGRVGIGFGPAGGSLIGGTGADSGTVFSSRAISSVVIYGDVEGGSGSSSASIFAGGTLNRVQIFGSLIGGAGNDSGRVETNQNIRSAAILGEIDGGSGLRSGTVRAGGSIGTLIIGSSSGETSGSILGGAGNDSGKVIAGARLSGATLVSNGGSITTARIFGSIIGGTGLNTGGLQLGDTLGQLYLRGSLEGGSTSIAGLDTSLPLTNTRTGYITAGRIGSMIVGGDIRSGINDGTGLADSGSIRVIGDIGKLLVQGGIIGQEDSRVVIAAGAGGGKNKAFGSVTINGNASFFDLLGGYTGNGSIANPLGTATNADAQIGTIQIGGQLLASNLVAGAVRGADLQFGTADDAIASGATVVNNARIVSTIARVIVGGIQTLPDSENVFGIVAQRINKASVGGVPVTLLSGPGNDDIEVGGTGTQVRIRELR